jgi:hypothetical protein
MKSFSASTIFQLPKLISAVFLLLLKFEHYMQLIVIKNIFNMRSAVEQLVYWSTAVQHSLPPAWSWASPQSNQSAGPVRFFIFCSISIFLLTSLVASRRPHCNAGAD